ncbi:MAG: biotin/lipoate A/B protein ligase family protein [Candidatus Nanoarchaeia archaeon]|nr:biotin/lipoate A/B protein ligase family protein [Candidatus Nanoarchaeia archaeon]
MKWRLIELETKNAFEAMAYEEALAESVAGGMNPTIHFWRWKPSAVSIGKFQSMEDDVDIKNCEKQGVDYIRRITGGGAVYHDYDGEITYGIVAPETILSKDITHSYKEISEWVINGLKTIGIDAEFKPINDIVTKGKKISGNAQTRKNNIIVHHGTILYDVNPEKMFSLLKVNDEKIKDKLISSAKERVTSVKQNSSVGYEETYYAIKDSFLRSKEYFKGKWTDREDKRAEELIKTKYKTKEWNFER